MLAIRGPVAAVPATIATARATPDGPKVAVGVVSQAVVSGHPAIASRLDLPVGRYALLMRLIWLDVRYFWNVLDFLESVFVAMAESSVAIVVTAIAVA